MKLFWTKEALLRLQDIEEYISRDNPAVAMEFVDKLISLAETLIDSPEKGRIVPKLSLENIRELIYKNTINFSARSESFKFFKGVGVVISYRIQSI